MGDFELKLKNIAEPSPKAKAMYQAVSELILENNSLDELTVSDITKKAGIKKLIQKSFIAEKSLISGTFKEKHIIAITLKCPIMTINIRSPFAISRNSNLLAFIIYLFIL